MSSKFENESVLISHLMNGDEQAYVYLVKTYHRPLSDYAFSLTKDRAMAQDIVQELFLYIWKRRKKLANIYSLKNYLYKMAYHQFSNEYRKSNAITALERSYMEALDEAVNDNNAELLNRKIAIVTEGIANLPKRCKETFLLSKKEGLTNIEIAEYLDISVKTVEGHITKAFHILRKTVGEQLKGVLFLMFGKIKTLKY
ncbi:RNA polymerase sigma factor [Flavivirga sp. 57AJ16]|uniref:RNA polymerase sigma factor n=1 Tax=Flavivirga sp. 57AJ16 TaxID=3025307 RepID=UPI002366F9A9|nr:sigma-70 family RNA polymerase sigma factor [Flavivirga sp. 57AJ16]MDD7888134.1 sigma-70 family RNA polymerase sigma factor [Flavivirga sp. 57AJ16]